MVKVHQAPLQVVEVHQATLLVVVVVHQAPLVVVEVHQAALLTTYMPGQTGARCWPRDSLHSQPPAPAHTQRLEAWSAQTRLFRGYPV